jgi:23S rRNA (pseudouridine1915-N3)-methyltransferase
MPKWVIEGYEEFAKRLPRECELILKEIPPAKRTKQATADQWKAQEAKALREALPAQTALWIFDEKGEQKTTKEWAGLLETWMMQGQDIALVIGGPDGLEASFKSESVGQLGLSKLTLPHPLVRIVVAEQIYRAWSLLNNHPYHRE